MLVIFDVSLFQPLILLGLLLGSVGYVAVGTLFAALAASTRGRESLLPVLLLPVMVPVFVAGVGLTANVIDGRTFVDVQRWVYLLAGFDLMALGLSWLLFDAIWEDV
jgi:heme exporter protein B